MPRTRAAARASEKDRDLARRIGQRLREARQRAGLTQQQLAGERYTKAYVSALETGIARPSMVALSFLSERLGLPASHFIDEAHPAWTRHRLKSQVSKIEPWTATTDYSDNGWKQLIKTARSFQKADRTVAAEALTGYLEKFANDPNQLSIEQGKVYLLVRVVFNAPERGSARIPFAQWERGNTDVNPDGTFNQAWPIMWNDGKPRLVAGRQGSAGPASATPRPQQR